MTKALFRGTALVILFFTFLTITGIAATAAVLSESAETAACCSHSGTPDSDADPAGPCPPDCSCCSSLILLHAIPGGAVSISDNIKRLHDGATPLTLSNYHQTIDYPPEHV